jgi:hypothetical protein
MRLTLNAFLPKGWWRKPGINRPARRKKQHSLPGSDPMASESKTVAKVYIRTASQRGHAITLFFNNKFDTRSNVPQTHRLDGPRVRLIFHSLLLIVAFQSFEVVTAADASVSYDKIGSPVEIFNLRSAIPPAECRDLWTRVKAGHSTSEADMASGRYPVGFAGNASTSSTNGIAGNSRNARRAGHHQRISACGDHFG